MAVDLRSELARRLSCEVLGAASPEFDRARRLWNAAVDRRPAAIVRCTAPDHVHSALSVAREAGVGVSIRGGGHGVAGRAVREGTVVLDLGGMRTVAVAVPSAPPLSRPATDRLRYLRQRPRAPLVEADRGQPIGRAGYQPGRRTA